MNEQLIRDVQEKLGLLVDGVAGVKTWTAIHAALVPEGSSVRIPPVLPESLNRPVSERSERVIATLLPDVQPYARSLINSAAARGIKIEATSGYRSYEEQDELYAKGRTKPGQIVTKARGGHSSHNFGTAFDVTVFDGQRPVWESPQYITVGQIGKDLGLSWGGDWTSSPDEPHFYLRPKWASGMTEIQLMAALRERHNTGQPIYT